MRSLAFAVLALSLAACSDEVARRASAQSIPPAPVAPSARQEPAETTVRATLASVGDVLPHLMVKAAARARARRGEDGADRNHRGYDDVFASLREGLARYDLASFNMESPVVREPLLPPMRMRFFADPAIPQALHDAGFDVAVCSNNHAFDQGGPGMVESHGHLRAAGLHTAGCGATLADARAPVIETVNGIRIAILSFTRVMNANNPARRAHPEWPQALFWYDEEPRGREVLEAIREVRRRDDVDVVVVNAHWDREYAPTPLERTRELAAILVAEGVDLIVGHHPHVLEPAEWMSGPDGRRSAVIYSLGNFVHEMCANRNPRDLCDRRLSAIAVATFAKTGGRAGLEDLGFEPAWMDHAAACPGEVDPPTRCVRPVIVRDELARIDRAIAASGTTPELAAEREGYALRDAVIRRFMGPHAQGASPTTPYVDVDRAIVSRSRHGPRRPFRD